jgi:uncharacterized protein (TIGR02452 family)
MASNTLTAFDEYKDTIQIGADHPFVVSKYVFDILAPSTPANILFLQQTTVEAALICHRIYPRICIHNFANNEAPAWNVFGGNTQEEHLFRKTNLSYSLDKKMYPICEGRTRTSIPTTARILYSPKITILKNDSYGQITPIQVAVASSAAAPAPRSKDFESFDGVYKPHHQDYFHEAEKELTRQKIRLMLSAARDDGCKIFITGAWGCGAFCNPLRGLAQLWREELATCGILCVVFAIPDKELLSEFKEHLS